MCLVYMNRKAQASWGGLKEIKKAAARAATEEGPKQDRSRADWAKSMLFLEQSKNSVAQAPTSKVEEMVERFLEENGSGKCSIRQYRSTTVRNAVKKVWKEWGLEEEVIEVQDSAPPVGPDARQPPVSSDAHATQQPPEAPIAVVGNDDPAPAQAEAVPQSPVSCAPHPKSNDTPDYPPRLSGVGLTNIGGVSCYYNSIMQCLYGMEGFCCKVLGEEKVKKGGPALQGLAGNIRTMEMKLSPEAVLEQGVRTRFYPGWQQHRQQDSSEFFVKTMDDFNENGAECHRHFRLQVQKTIKCGSCGVEKVSAPIPQTNIMYQPSPESPDLQSFLDGY